MNSYTSSRLKSGRRTIYWITASIFVIAGAGITSLPMLVKLLLRGAPTVATVNGLPIPVAEYRERVRRSDELLALYRQHFGIRFKKILTHYLGQSDRPEEIALEELINEKLALSLARSIPLVLAPEYICLQLGRPAVMQAVVGELALRYLFSQQGILDQSMLRRYVSSRGLSIQEFETIAEERLTERFAYLLAQESAYVPRARLRRDAVVTQGTRTLALTTISLSDPRVADHRIPAEAEIEAHFSTCNRVARTFWSPERRNGTVWRFDLALFGGNSFLQAAEEAIISPNPRQLTSFIGDNHGTKSSLHHVSSSSDDPVIAALFSIEELHGRIPVIKKGYGYIIELDDIFPREPMPLAVARDEVIADLQRRASEARARTLLKSSAASLKSTTVTLSPRPSESKSESETEEADIPALVDLGLTRESLNHLYREGEELMGLADGGIFYRFVVTTVTPAPLRLIPSPEQRNALQELTMRVLIASLREHAILVMSKEEAL